MARDGRSPSNVKLLPLHNTTMLVGTPPIVADHTALEIGLSENRAHGRAANRVGDIVHDHDRIAGHENRVPRFAGLLLTGWLIHHRRPAAGGDKRDHIAQQAFAGRPAGGVDAEDWCVRHRAANERRQDRRQGDGARHAVHEWELGNQILDDLERGLGLLRRRYVWNWRNLEVA